MNAALEILLAAVPSIVAAMSAWFIQRSFKNRESTQSSKEVSKKQYDLLLIEGVNAAIALCEATANAVERIPDANCNGDMRLSKEYAKATKHKLSDFLHQQGVESLHK